MKFKKKQLLIIPAVLIPILIIGLVFILTKNKNSEIANPLAQQNTSKNKKKQEETFDFKLTKWEDPAGFAFEYPEELETDKNVDVEDYYAYLELTHKEKPGNILVAVIDAQYPTIEDWASQDEEIKEYPSLDTKIAEFEAKKVNKDGEVINAFIDPDQVIYTIHKKDREKQAYWTAVYDKLLETFELIPLEGETQAEFSNWMKDFDTSSVDVVQPVEVIQ